MLSLRFITLAVYLTRLFLVQAARTPRIGFEIETPHMPIFNSECTDEENTAMKGHRVLGQTGNGWFLGVDTSPAVKSLLNLEYDLLCDLGNTHELESIIGNVMANMAELDTRDTFIIQDSKGYRDNCNPWRKLAFPGVSKVSGKATWDVQATAPLMLEAVQDLLIAAFQKEDHPLVIKQKNWMKNLVYVQKNWFDSKYFQEATGGSDWATKDVIGFLSIMLTNIKEARELTASIFHPLIRKGISTQGPKTLVWLMPRNSWTSVFSLVKKKLPESVQLWAILEHLACYQNTKDGKLKLDKRFCRGTVDNPQPNGKLQDKTWSLKGGGDPLSVKTWVESIVSRPAGSLDALSEWDAKHFDGQIGAFDKLGKTLEQVLDSSREVSLWEFRGLGYSRKADLPKRIDQIQGAVVKFHKRYPQEPIS
ncbi:hypothetical protein CDEST_09193 [Colletotrichum destructivum]|uniref:Uncharacterized protein n=1 Tax=Colletotrichum destructivum TaxID=34406 RepID=A0AAX4ILG6_9PEZI|nr:hypothetical protein CDEST_09193 [Colletotrichum destructivum]